MLVAVSLGIPSLLLAYEKSKSHESIDKGKEDSLEEQTITAPSKKEETPIDQPLLPDKMLNVIGKVNNGLLDVIYEQAHREAITIYHDAQLSGFTIQVFPFVEGDRVNVYLDFYSKWANKKCSFVSYECAQQVKHLSPDKRAFRDYQRRVYAVLPWKESPQWMQFIHRAYTRIEPLTPDEKTTYHLLAYQNANIIWRLFFEDGFSGREHRFEWDGKGFDESNMTQSR